MICGIDGGLKGAIGIADANRVIKIYEMPPDLLSLESIFLRHNVSRVYIEKAQTFGRQPWVCADCGALDDPRLKKKGDGVKGLFNYAQAYGEIKGMMKVMKIGFVEVPPKVWQKKMHAGTTAKADTKTKSYETCQKLMPWIEMRTMNKRTGKLSAAFHDGIADAGCITEFGRLDYFINGCQIGASF